MPCYSVIFSTPTNTDWLPGYAPVATAAVARHGGRYLARTASHEQIEGEESAAAIRVIIEWPSKQAALDFMSDPEYKPQLEARLAGSIGEHFLVEGLDDLA